MITITPPKQTTQRPSATREQSGQFEQQGAGARQVGQDTQDAPKQVNADKPQSFEVDLMDDWFKA